MAAVAMALLSAGCGGRSPTKVCDVLFGGLEIQVGELRDEAHTARLGWRLTSGEIAVARIPADQVDQAWLATIRVPETARRPAP